VSTPETNLCHCLETASIAVFEGHFGICNVVVLWRISANKASSSINCLLEESMKRYAEKI